MSVTELDVKSFLTIARTKNISKAARLLGVTQPTLSQSLVRLENSVGSRLMIRGRRGCELTQSGHRVLAKMTEFSEIWSTIKRSASQSDHDVVGTFRIGAHATVARYLFPKFVEALQKSAPGVSISTYHSLSREIMNKLIQYELDLGVVVNPIRHPDFVIQKIASDHIGIYESARSRKSDWLFADTNLHQIDDILKKLQQSDFEYSKLIEMNSLEVILELTQRGLGYGILPERLANTVSPRLKLVDIKLPTFEDAICICYRKEVLSTPGGRALLESMKVAGVTLHEK